MLKSVEKVFPKHVSIFLKTKNNYKTFPKMHMQDWNVKNRNYQHFQVTLVRSILCKPRVALLIMNMDNVSI